MEPHCSIWRGKHDCDGCELKALCCPKVPSRRCPVVRWDRVPRRGVTGAVGHRVRRQEPGRSAGDSRKADSGIIAQRRDGFQCYVAGPLDGPFIVLFEQDRAYEANDRVFVGEDADHLGAPLDLAVETFDRVSRVQFGPMLWWECHVGEHIGLGLVEEAGKLGQLGAELVGDLAPLGCCGIGVVLGERCGDEGG
jgi:hypothetical protein